MSKKVEYRQIVPCAHDCWAMFEQVDGSHELERVLLWAWEVRQSGGCYPDTFWYSFSSPDHAVVGLIATEIGLTSAESMGNFAGYRVDVGLHKDE